MVTREEFRRLCLDILDEYADKAKVPFTFSVVFRRFRRIWGRSVHKAPVPIVVVNSWLIKFYEVDPNLTLIALRYVLAHEVAHFKQRVDKGLFYFMSTHPLAVQLEAERMAEELTGITRDQFGEALDKLAEVVWK